MTICAQSLHLFRFQVLFQGIFCIIHHTSTFGTRNLTQKGTTLQVWMMRWDAPDGSG